LDHKSVIKDSCSESVRLSAYELLKGIENDGNDMEKLTDEINKAIESFEQKNEQIANDIAFMSKTIQNRTSNMFLNVINNIKK
jgi:hypothetical protein